MTAASAQDKSPRALAEHTCKGQPDYAMRGYTNGIPEVYEGMHRAFIAARRVAPAQADRAQTLHQFATLKRIEAGIGGDIVVRGPKGSSIEGLETAPGA